MGRIRYCGSASAFASKSLNPSSMEGDLQIQRHPVRAIRLSDASSRQLSTCGTVPSRNPGQMDPYFIRRFAHPEESRRQTCRLKRYVRISCRGFRIRHHYVLRDALRELKYVAIALQLARSVARVSLHGAYPVLPLAVSWSLGIAHSVEGLSRGTECGWAVMPRTVVQPGGHSPSSSVSALVRPSTGVVADSRVATPPSLAGLFQYSSTASTASGSVHQGYRHWVLGRAGRLAEVVLAPSMSVAVSPRRW